MEVKQTFPVFLKAAWGSRENQEAKEITNWRNCLSERELRNRIMPRWVVFLTQLFFKQSLRPYPS